MKQLKYIFSKIALPPYVSRKEVFAFLVFLLISAALPITIFLTQRRQEIRTKAQLVNHIILKEKGERDGYHYWLYENTRYPCGKSGYHEFLILQKGELVNKRKLLVGFHGGAAGFYKSDGSYVPKESYTDFLYADKEREVMFNSVLSDGLVKLFRDRDDWRILGPSYCSHDFFLGKGEYSEFDGFSRWGYLAAQEAIDFTQEYFSTEVIVTYGVSAGASGAFYHGYERDNVAGIVMDSNSMDLSAINFNCKLGISTCCLDVNICECFDLGRNCVEILAERIGFLMGEDEPHLLIEAGKVQKPIYFIWNKKDIFYKKENTKYFMENLDGVIEQFNPGVQSVAEEVCVTCPGCEACTVHCPTGFDGPETDEVGEWIDSLKIVVQCNKFCLHPRLVCAEGLECRPTSDLLGSDKCRNPVCPDEEDCLCPTPTPTPVRCAKEGEVCYGFAGLPCCEGLVCVEEFPPQPDKGGICQPGKPSPKPTPTPTLPPMPENCNDECISRGYESGYCDSAAVYPGETLCEPGEINIGETQDCFVPLGILGANKGCCCVPSPTPTPEPEKARLTFKIKFQGINQQRSDKIVKVILKQGDQEKYRFDSLGVSSDQNGIYSGIINDIDLGTYDIYIKGSSHLQKKFAGITLAEGENILDWSGTEILVGDATGDNLINIQDFRVLVEDYLTSESPADFNLDGIVNIQDFRFIVENYLAQGDE